MPALRRLATLALLIIATSTVAHAQQPQGRRRVYVGIYAFQVPNLDIGHNAYLIDFWLWFRWQGDDIDPSQTFEFMNQYEAWDALREYGYVDERGNPQPEQIDGWRYQMLHVQGRFQRTFDLRNYPFDHQLLDIVVEETTSTTDTLLYVADHESEVADRGLSIPGWRLDRVTTAVSQAVYGTNFGDPRHPTGSDHFSRFTYRISISRPASGYLVITFLPITMVMLITLVVFLIPLRYFEGRLGLGITALISAVALELTSAGELPQTDYLLLLDHVYDLSYFVIFIASIESVIAVRVHDDGKESTARKIDRYSLIFCAVAYFGGLITLILGAM